MGAMERFDQVRQDRHQYAQEWKARTGQKVAGFMCTYVPEEIIYAAGALPVRILGSHEPTDITESHIPSMWCPYCRDCLAQGLLGRYDYLDGIVHGFTCAHIFQTYNSWYRNIPIGYHYDIYVPEYIQNPFAKDCLTREIRDFQHSLEQWMGKTITDADFDRAIDVYNTSSRLLHQVYELRRRPQPALSGAEAMTMVLASALMDKAAHNQLLQQALSELEQRPGIADPGVRLMLMGSENDDVDFIRFIETLGATVVIEEHCTGSRYFWQPIVPEPDRAAAIAARYLNRPPCPHKELVGRTRFSHLLKLVQDYQVQGVIIILEKFCDIYQYEVPPVQDLFKKQNIPVLLLEVDVTVPVGQFRTRIEAFLETMALETV